MYNTSAFYSWMKHANTYFSQKNKPKLKLGHPYILLNKKKCQYSILSYHQMKKYTAFRQGGNGIFIERRVAHFSASTLPFPASDNAVIR
jgi:hypothetical protein